METGQPRHHGNAPLDVDAIDLLTEDHRLVREYFQHIEMASNTSTAADRHRRPALVQQLCDELEIHDKIEREIFYPAVRAAFKESDDTMVEEAEREHDQVVRMIAELRRLPPEDGRVDALLAELRKAVEHHVHEEEERMFTLARSQIDGMAVGRQLRQQKRSLQEQMFGRC